MKITDLRDRHKGETAYIVGRGPSLLRVRATDFGAGPIITLNAAILYVRRLSLPNPIYAMEKDGCYPGMTVIGVREPCGHCPSGLTVQPVEPETLLVSVDESPHCFADYPRRYLFDVIADLGRPKRSNMSSPVAVRIAQFMGCTALVMLGHDAYTSGESRFVAHDGSLVEERALAAYAQAGQQSNALAVAAGMPIRWVTA